MGILADLLVQRFGVKTHCVESAPGKQVTAVSGAIALNNPDRLGLLFINLSSNLIYVRPAPGAADNAGIVLAANGGWCSFEWDTDWELVSMIWHGIAPAGASNIYVLEVIGGK
jgi:hypothetical protein